MAHASDPTTLALLGLRLKGFGDAASIAAILGVDEADLTPVLTELAGQGLAMHREGGAISGWALTPDGRAAGEKALAADLEEAGATDVVQGAYEDFLDLNGQMLALCTDWQVRADLDGETLNDHSDADYDAGVMDRLRTIDGELAPILDDLASTLDRYANYAPRFSAALERLDNGELEYFTKPIIPSYHTVWFELHEDLLASLNIDRADEAKNLGH